jgi:hypothetical protein
MRFPVKPVIIAFVLLGVVGVAALATGLPGVHVSWVNLLAAFTTSCFAGAIALALRVRRARDHRGAIIGAYLGAAFMPLIGIGFGIYLLAKRNFVDGVYSIILAFLIISFWYYLEYLQFPPVCGSC